MFSRHGQGGQCKRTKASDQVGKFYERHNGYDGKDIPVIMYKAGILSRMTCALYNGMGLKGFFIVASIELSYLIV